MVSLSAFALFSSLAQASDPPKFTAKPTVTKTGRLNRKVLVFTAFADTAAYLYDNLHLWTQTELGIHLALVTGGGSNKATYQPKGYRQHTEFNHILTNFSPIAKQRAKICAPKQMPMSGLSAPWKARTRSRIGAMAAYLSSSLALITPPSTSAPS